MSVKAKKVSNYELFYDLVFVLATGSLVSMLHGGEGHHQTIGWFELMQFTVAIVSIWNVWFLQNFYLNRYSRRDANDIYTIIASMLVIGNAVMLIARNWQTEVISFNGIEAPVFVFFNILLMVAYGLIIVQYLLHSRRYNIWTTDIKYQIAICLMTICLIAIAVVVTLLIPAEYGAFVFLVAYLLILTVPFFGRRYADESLTNFPHMVERMQLITILSFGETVIALIRTYSLATNFVVSILSFTMLGFLFIMYISQTALNMEHHQQTTPTLLLYAHVGVLIGIDYMTTASEMVEGNTLGTVSLAMLYGGMGLYYCCLFATSVYNKEGLALTKNQLFYHLVVYSLAGILLCFTQGELWQVFAILAGMNFLMMRISWRYRREWILKNIEF